MKRSILVAVSASALVMGIAPQTRAQSAQRGDQPQGQPHEREDSAHRPDPLWLSAEAGGSYVNPRTPVSGGGAMLGAAAGLRFGIWTLGAGFRVHPQAELTLYQVQAEGGLHLPLGAWAPYAKLRGGYVSVSPTRSTDPNDAPSGLDLGLSVGCDFDVSSRISVGLDATADTFLFSRSLGGTLRPSETGTTVENAPGYALLGSLHAGLHFDL